MYHGLSLELMAYSRHQALLDEAAQRRLIREAAGARPSAGAARTLRRIASWAAAATNALPRQWGARQHRWRWAPAPQNAPVTCGAPVSLPARIPTRIAA